MGADEIHRGKAQKFYTVLPDLVHNEVIGLAKDRTENSLAGLLTTCLDARQREGVAAFLFGWLKTLRWQRLPEMEKLGDTLVSHFDGSAAS